MHNTTFRFGVGDKIFVIDGSIIDFTDIGLMASEHHEYKNLTIKSAVVRDLHSHPERMPYYPCGEGYSLSGNLMWDCYHGSRVFANYEEAELARPALEDLQKEDAENLREELLDELINA